MRWGRSRYGGKFHAMFGNATLCGVRVHVETTETPNFEHRCENCDEEWRDRGRKNKPSDPAPDPSVYVPRHTFHDYEARQ